MLFTPPGLRAPGSSGELFPVLLLLFALFSTAPATLPAYDERAVEDESQATEPKPAAGASAGAGESAAAERDGAKGSALPEEPSKLPAEASKKSTTETPPPKVAPAPTPGNPVLETISGAFVGAIRYREAVGGAGSFQVGETSVPLAEALSIRFVEKKVSPLEALLFLGGDDELFATRLGGDESNLRFRAYAAKGGAGEGELSLPLEALRAIGFPRQFKEEGKGVALIRRWLRGPARGLRPAAAEGAKKGPQEEEDRLLLTEGAELKGVLEKVNGEAVYFRSRSAGGLRLPLEKVRAVSIAALGGSGREREEKRGVTAVVQFQDGSSLAGNLLALDGESGLRLETRALGDISAPLERVRALSFRGGRCQYLSDLEPARIVQRGDLFSTWELARDLSATGEPIRIRGREFKKGLGMHSHCRVDYDLSGQFSRFQSVIGMDDRARPETNEALAVNGGVAVFRVHVDGRVALEKQLSWSDPPYTVDLSIEGAKVLGLELDDGPGLLVLDRGDWADARIIRKD